MKINDALNEKFDLSEPPEANTELAVQAPASVTAPEPETTSVAVVEAGTDQVTEDLTKARNTITKAIDQGIASMQELANVAKNSEHPRAYEVMATMLKTISEMSKDLVDLQETRRSLNRNDEQSDTPTVKNQQNIFVGSTQELLQLINSADNVQIAAATMIEE
jgi:hypothetical protein